MATLFIVKGPCEIPVYQGKAGRSITDENIDDFWEQYPDLATERGCYVFGIRAAKGYKPAYAGKASKNFAQETFSYHKLTKYQQYLADVGRGTPVMFFVIAPKKKGAPNSKHIAQLEDFLIQAGVAANSRFLNIRGTKVEEWGIAGVIRGSKRRRSKGAAEFIRLMKISD